MDEMRTPPNSREAEQAALGAIIMGAYEGCVERLIPILKPEYFYNPSNRLIFECVIQLYERNLTCELMAIRDALTQRGKLDAVGGVDYLTLIGENTPGTANAEYYAKIVREKAVLRNMIQTAAEILDDCYDPGAEPTTIIELAEQALLSTTCEIVHSHTVTTADISHDVLKAILSRKQGTFQGLPTGLEDLDRKTHGLKAGEMTVIAGRTGMGKTALMLHMVEHIALDKETPVAMFSLEMTDSALIERMLGSRAGVDLHSLSSGCLTDDAEQKLRIASEEIHAAPILIEGSLNLTARSLRTKARRLVRKHGAKLVVVDYLQLIRSPDGRGQDRYLQIGEVSRALKALSIELDIPVVALSQLNRSSESREGHRPRISDLRESGNIEQDADVVLLVHRPGYYDNNLKDNTAEIIIGKNRNGPTGSVEVTWYANCVSFHDEWPQ